MAQIMSFFPWLFRTKARRTMACRDINLFDCTRKIIAVYSGGKLLLTGFEIRDITRLRKFYFGLREYLVSAVLCTSSFREDVQILIECRWDKSDCFNLVMAYVRDCLKIHYITSEQAGGDLKVSQTIYEDAYIKEAKTIRRLIRLA